MKSESYTKQRLIGEVAELRGKVAELEEAAERSRSVEKAIEKAKRQWERTFDSVPDLMAIIDKNYQVIRLNKPMAHRCGLDPRDAVGMKCYKLFHGTDCPPPACPHKLMWETGEETEAEVFSPTLGGTFLISVSPFHNSEGKLIGSIHVARDVSLLKKAEEALRESEARYRALVDVSPVAIVVVADDRYVFVNQEAVKMAGVESADQILGLRPEEIVEPGYRSVVEEQIRKPLIEGRTISPVELQIRRRMDGTIRDLEVAASPVIHRGRPAAQFVIRDITDRKRARQRLVESEERFRAVFESARECIFVKDRDRRYTHVNPYMESLLELPASFIVGRTDEELYGPKAGSHLKAVDFRVLEGESVEQEHTRSIKGNSVTFLDVRVPMRNADREVVGICGIARNITGRKPVRYLDSPEDEEYRSEAMKSILQAAAMAAQTDSVVLLTGESGSGKDYLARVIHDNSKRAEGPFFSINCAAVAPELAESELFGHEPGAYTGARGRQRGLLELAEGGTLLLNEIGELPLTLQAKLLTFLDSRCFTRVGGRENIRVDARLIAATNRDVRKEVSEGNFRADLFYRLNVLSIKMPPLRERGKDIPVLVRRIVNELGRELQLHEAPEIDAQAMRRLSRYEWPGNVRELRNVIERCLILSGGTRLSIDSLGLELKESSYTNWTVAFPPRSSLTETLADLKSRFIEEALSRCGGNQQQAAMILGISRFALGRHLKKLEQE